MIKVIKCPLIQILSVFYSSFYRDLVGVQSTPFFVISVPRRSMCLVMKMIVTPDLWIIWSNVVL